LKKWYFWATHSRIELVIDAARSVKRHRDGILRWFDSGAAPGCLTRGIANGLIEGINSMAQAATAQPATSRPSSIGWPASPTCGYPRDDVSTHPK